MTKSAGKKIVLITTGQPSTNPRIVKEADALQQAGHDVTVLYCFFVQWAQEKDEALLKQVSWKYILIGGTPRQQPWLYWFTRLRAKCMTKLNQLLGNRWMLAEYSLTRCYTELLKAAKGIRADWYIGHNLAALPVTVKAAAFHGSKAGFDFEDYHRGELLPGETSAVNRVAFIEHRYVPSLHYISTASPLITAITKQHHAAFSGKIITILNCFPLEQQPAFVAKNDHTSLSLFWFSQTIGTNRGLETLFDALEYLMDPSIELTLAGRLDAGLQEYLLTKPAMVQQQVQFAGIIQPDALPAFAARFDVGMAIELTVPFNRDICLTNKIFTYLLAGNAIILSATQMQEAFNQQFHIGQPFEPGNVESLAAAIRYYKNSQTLAAQRSYNYQLARQQFNWQAECKPLLEIVT